MFLPTSYMQIPKVQKRLMAIDGLTVFYALLGSAGIKALRKLLVELTPSFYLRKISVAFCSHGPWLDEKENDESNLCKDLRNPIVQEENVPNETQFRIC
jgi:hypothetical protein